MNEPEDLMSGAGHADKIGAVVVLDVDARDGRTLYTGVLTEARDQVTVDGKPQRTTLRLGGRVIDLNWVTDETLTVKISKVR